MTPKQAEGKVSVSYLAPMSGQTWPTAKIVNGSLPLSINLAPFAERDAAYDEDEAGRMIAPQVYTTRKAQRSPYTPCPGFTPRRARAVGATRGQHGARDQPLPPAGDVRLAQGAREPLVLAHAAPR